MFSVHQKTRRAWLVLSRQLENPVKSKMEAYSKFHPNIPRPFSIISFVHQFPIDLIGQS